MQLSLIIPTFNEEHNLKRLLPYLHNYSSGYMAEIIIVDCGSSDKTIKIAKEYGAKVIVTNQKGRARQMNIASLEAKGEVLYFVHADTIPPSGFDKLIIDSVREGRNAGCFTSIFDWNHPFLRFCNYFSRLPFWFCRGGGQTLFVSKHLFNACKGFDESMIIMEEYELIDRLTTSTKFKIVKRNAITSARDYRANGPFKLQFVYACVFVLYALGASQDYMLDFVGRHIAKPSRSCN
jgi:rSAM/selenodomain-associated transferase 2